MSQVELAQAIPADMTANPATGAVAGTALNAFGAALAKSIFEHGPLGSSGGACYTLVAGPQSTYLTGWVRAGEIFVSPSAQCTLSMIVQCSYGRTLYWRLWNQTDGIEVASGSSTSSVGERLQVTLVPGQTGFPAGAEKRLALHIKADSGASQQSTITIVQAEIRQ